MNNQGKIIEIDIKTEMKRSYIDYAMSVIVGRALPSVEDGLKPVHRRILYSMHELGLTSDKPFRKCARIVGDVLGKYHPHGDTAVYNALVRLAQDFSMRKTLVEGHGNFGSVDGDMAAAMRYTEARMSKIASEMLRDINMNTVDFIPNFDGEENEPTLLPSRYPNLLVNGSSGIAVGMATNIPPHNLGEVIDATVKVIENPDVDVYELMTNIKGPDFPTGGSIMGNYGIRKAYETGRGKVIVRAKAIIEEYDGKFRIVINEIPYQVNKAKLVEDIANLIKDKKVIGISDLRDESDRDGMRIVIELKKEANPNLILNQLYKHTKLQDTFGIILLALVNNEPKVLTLKEIIEEYIKFQKSVITRRTEFELKKAEERAHILQGLKIAIDNIDEVIRIIRASKNIESAKFELIEKFELTDIQATAIVDLRLRRLTGLERDKIEQELGELINLIARLKEILSDEKLILNIIKTELLEIKNKYDNPRKSDIVPAENEIDIEDLIEEKEVIITLTNDGYIKRIESDSYQSQKRGGKGIQAMKTKEDDFVDNLIICNTHDDILFFSNQGKVYRLRGYEIPEASRIAKGMNLVNLLDLSQEEKIKAVLPLKKDNEIKNLIMCTTKGIVKRTDIEKFKNIRKSGLIALTLRDGDELLKVKGTRGDAEIVIVTENAYSIIFNENEVRQMGRTASGVKSIRLGKEDKVVEMDIVSKGEDLLVVSKNGYGKRTGIEEYKSQKRAGKGIKTYKISEKTGKIVGARIVNEDNEFMLINSSGVAIRLNVKDISKTSRSAMGARLMKTSENEEIVAITKITISDEEID